VNLAVNDHLFHVAFALRWRLGTAVQWGHHGLDTKNTKQLLLQQT